MKQAPGLRVEEMKRDIFNKKGRAVVRWWFDRDWTEYCVCLTETNTQRKHHVAPSVDGNNEYDNGADSESDAKAEKLLKRLSQFEEDELLSFLIQQKNDKSQLWGSTCYEKLRMEQVS